MSASPGWQRQLGMMITSANLHLSFPALTAGLPEYNQRGGFDIGTQNSIARTIFELCCDDRYHASGGFGDASRYVGISGTVG